MQVYCFGQPRLKPGNLKLVGCYRFATEYHGYKGLYSIAIQCLQVTVKIAILRYKGTNYKLLADVPPAFRGPCIWKETQAENIIKATKDINLKIW